MKQKTFVNQNIEKLDAEVNDFESKNHVRATQSYSVSAPHKDYAEQHVRVLFYEEKTDSTLEAHLRILVSHKEKLLNAQIVKLRDHMQEEINKRKEANGQANKSE